jgi:hypothetical protein
VVQPRICTPPFWLTRKAQELLIRRALTWLGLPPTGPAGIDFFRRGEGLLGKRRSLVQQSDSRRKVRATNRHTQPVFTPKRAYRDSRGEGLGLKPEGLERTDEKCAAVEVVTEAAKSKGSASPAVKPVAPMTPTLTVRPRGACAHKKSEGEAALEEPRGTQGHLLDISTP